ncbi:MAG: cobalamin biosynthesis central domain-containing protein [Gammaproteobacteria bacterium]
MKSLEQVAIVAITRRGAELAARLAAHMPQATLVVANPFAPGLKRVTNPVRAYGGALRAQVAGLFAAYDPIVFVLSVGAVVRLIAPHLQSKAEDPAILVIDEAGHFVIPVLGGHQGGANAFAEGIAAWLEAVPVLTTASDVGHTLAVDILGRELGWRVEAPKLNITRVSAHVVNGDPVALVQEAGARDWWTRPTPLPSNIHLFDRFEALDARQFRGVLWVTRRAVPGALWDSLAERLVVYRPPPGQE